MTCTDASDITAVPVIIPDITTTNAIYSVLGAPTNAPISAPTNAPISAPTTNMPTPIPTDKSGKYV
jgi:hypothetical protein